MISSRESPSIPNRCRRLRTNDDVAAMFIKGGSIGRSGGARKVPLRPSPAHAESKHAVMPAEHARGR